MGNSSKDTIYIKEIRIKHFRSIYDITIKNIENITAITGPNDAGKSNILRALNLFFNDEIEPGIKLDFQRDFNFVRNSETRAQKSSKERRFINVTIIFNRPSSSELKCRTIKISRWWYENKENIEYYLDNKRAEGPGKRTAISKLLKRTIFEYVPAQRSKYYWKYLFDRFRESFFGPKNKVTKNYIDKLNTQISAITKEFEKTFKQLTGISTRLELPQDLSSLFQSMKILTNSQTFETLESRGDGIQNTYLAVLLNYISERENEQRKRVIWGFEEPENSLESNLASKLADEFINTYQKNAQIFLTTHSIPFIARHKKGLNVIRVERINDKNGTAVVEGDDIIQIMECVDKNLANLIRENEEKEKKLEEMQRDNKRGIVIVEGENDMKVFVHLWNLLYPDKKQELNDQKTDLFQFYIESGQTNDSANDSGSQKRLRLAKSIANKQKKKVLIIEDRDDEKNDGEIKNSNLKKLVKRKRLSLRNLDTYFLDDRLLSIAFDVDELKIREFVEDMTKISEPLIPQVIRKLSGVEINGKTIIDGINKKLGKKRDKNWIYIYDVVKHIKDPSEIDNELEEVVQCMEWLISDS